jgi:hypothetical protein
MQTRCMIRSVGLAALVGFLPLNSPASIELASDDTTWGYHDYEPNPPPESGGTSADVFSVSFPDSTAVLASDTHVSITLNAPAGQMFVVNYQGGWARLDFYLYYGTSFSSPYASTSNPQLTFTVVNGAAPTSLFYNQMLPKGTGNELYALGSAMITSGFSFTSLNVSFDYDNSGMTAAPLTSFFTSEIRFSNETGSDPGQLLTLESVPEPARAGLLAVAFLGTVAGGQALRRRRQRKTM